MCGYIYIYIYIYVCVCVCVSVCVSVWNICIYMYVRGLYIRVLFLKILSSVHTITRQIKGKKYLYIKMWVCMCTCMFKFYVYIIRSLLYISVSIPMYVHNGVWIRPSNNNLTTYHFAQFLMAAPTADSEAEAIQFAATFQLITSN